MTMHPLQMSMSLVVAGLLLGLMGLCFPGCVSDAPPSNVCPTLTTVSAEQRTQLAAEVQKLPPGSVTAWVVGDWIALRDQVRACQRVAGR